MYDREKENVFSEGLSDRKAAELWENGYGNVIDDSNAETTKEIIRKNTLTFFNMVFFVLAFLLILAGSFRDMAFLVIALLNSLIGIVQQLRSKALLNKIKLLVETKTTVVRSGREKEVPSHQLVQGDVVKLKTGNQIPADGKVLCGSVQVNESVLTGEADLVKKEEKDKLMSGSYVASGSCYMKLEKVGEDSYAAQLTQKAKENKGEHKSGMMKSLDKLIRVIGIGLFPIGIALFYNEYIVNGNSFSSSIPSVVAALIGMIPEGLYLLTSMALAVSVMRLSKQKVLVHEMSAIETLARTDVLCVDKTGTITSSDMSVENMICLKENVYSRKRVEEILNACYTVLDAENDTGRAMAAYFHTPCHLEVEFTIPFTSANKWTAVGLKEIGTCVIGAPEFVLGENYQKVKALVEPYQKEGCRVLLAAISDEPPKEDELCGEIVPIALVIIGNPVRKDAPETFRYFAENGVKVKVISGDNPSSVSKIAKLAEIEEADNYIDASLLKSKEDYEKAVEQYTVFGRVTPDQKSRLIQALQEQGHIVAMTGDGVNDVLALKDADCGIAMASGTDAACQAAQLVLVDSEFSKMPEVVKEGRRVINNIQRSASLYLVKNIMSFFLAIITLVAGMQYPFVPIQLTFISALTIGIPSFVLAMEQNYDLVKGKFMQNVLRRALPGGLTNIVLLVGVELFTLAFSFEHETLSTISTALMGAVGLLVVYYVSKPLNWKRRILITCMGIIMVVVFVRYGTFIQLTALDLRGILVLVVFLALSPSVIYLFEWILKKLEAVVSKFKRKR